MKITLVQHEIIWENPVSSMAHISSLLKNCGDETDLMLFPEMTLSGFSMNVEKTSTSPADDDFFAGIASGHSCTVVYGRVQDGYNCLRAIDKSGQILADYRKIHRFAYAGEDRFYQAGAESLTFSQDGVRITPFVCYDLRFSYLFWGKAADTDVFIVIANWPASRSEHWETLLRARAVENQAYVIGVNRTGTDPNAAYSGGSAVISPAGKILLDCGSGEGVFTADVDISAVRETRKSFPFHRDRLR
jgi:predicted amidohydrolase